MKSGGQLTEELVSDLIPRALKENPEGKVVYSVLEFDQRSLDLLSTGVAETLRQSDCVPNGDSGYRAVKHTADVILSVLGLLLLVFLMGITALVIYAQDGGSPIFSQMRLTENGKVFRMYKFRSMCLDAESCFAEVQQENETDGLAFKSENDPHITKVG